MTFLEIKNESFEGIFLALVELILLLHIMFCALCEKNLINSWIFEVFCGKNSGLSRFRVPAGFRFGFGSGRVLPEVEKMRSGRVPVQPLLIR